MLLKTPSQTDLAQCAIRGIGRDEPQCEHPGQVRYGTTYGANKFHFNMLSFLWFFGTWPDFCVFVFSWMSKIAHPLKNIYPRTRGDSVHLWRSFYLFRLWPKWLKRLSGWENIYLFYNIKKSEINKYVRWPVPFGRHYISFSSTVKHNSITCGVMTYFNITTKSIWN